MTFLGCLEVGFCCQGIIDVIVVIVTGGKESQPSLPLDGFRFDLDRLWLEFDKNGFCNE